MKFSVTYVYDISEEDALAMIPFGGDPYRPGVTAEQLLPIAGYQAKSISAERDEIPEEREARHDAEYFDADTVEKSLDVYLGRW